MSYSTKSGEDETLMDSWVDLNCGECSTPSRHSTPVPSVINSGKLERLLREAQKESNPSSRASPKTPRTPKSPCSPKSSCEPHDLLPDDINEPSQPEVLLLPVDVYISRRQGSTDWIWDWSSRAEQNKTKDTQMHHGKNSKSGFSFRKSKVVKSGLFSSEVLSVLIVTNVLSILVGAGIGLYISKQVASSIFHLPKH